MAELLRFATAGSVDDGKSTLIGRLLYDSKAILEDQLEAVERASIQRGEETNLARALATPEGLRSGSVGEWSDAAGDGRRDAQQELATSDRHPLL